MERWKEKKISDYYCRKATARILTEVKKYEQLEKDLNNVGVSLGLDTIQFEESSLRNLRNYLDNVNKSNSAKSVINKPLLKLVYIITEMTNLRGTYVMFKNVVSKHEDTMRDIIKNGVGNDR